ncbi:MAG: hypothetical protein VX731_01245 [Candidatus Neomarinimicrobiota bacterium]|nr:hypothetical protein [Candidatus Neomarinimicrobiota bacterium]
MSESNIVFSTNSDFNRKQDSPKQNNHSTKQNLRIHLDRRGGVKIVTLIKVFK